MQATVAVDVDVDVELVLAVEMVEAVELLVVVVVVVHVRHRAGHKSGETVVFACVLGSAVLVPASAVDTTNVVPSSGAKVVCSTKPVVVVTNVDMAELVGDRSQSLRAYAWHSSGSYFPRQVG